MSAAIELQRTFERTLQAVREVGLPHAFIGALAAVAWGRSRTTTDIDLVVACEPSTYPHLEAALRARSLSPGKHIGPEDPSDVLPDVAIFWSPEAPPVRVDVFIAKTPFETAVLQRRRTAEVLGATVELASPESVIIYKALAGRGKDWSDLEGVFDAQRAAGNPLDWEFIDAWARAWELTEKLAPFRSRYGPRAPE